MQKTAIKQKVVILGIDAMDPAITERLMDEGKLPNLSRLKSEGAYSRLSTTIPAESVVAWSSFATGLRPGYHGIFDFIMRDPKTYTPYLSMNEILSGPGGIKIKIRKKGKSFWSALSRKHIPSFIYFCPNTFPPEPIFGRMLSGMGTTDISGTMGKFIFYTSKALSKEDAASRGKVVAVNPAEHDITTDICGPKISRAGSNADITIPLRITVNPEKDKARLQFQGKSLSLKAGEWSDWQEVSFKIGYFRKMDGITRFYLRSIKPYFQLYAGPINFNPLAPVFAVSFPADYSKKIAEKIGLYHTQGMPHDTWALSEDRLDEKAFLEQVEQILDERKKILDSELKKFKRGAFFLYLDTLDVVQHMFWRYTDPAHALYEKDSLYRDIIPLYYEKIDAVIGTVMKHADDDTVLIVMSDHGFGPYRRSVHLNRWLLENGYLVLKNGADESKEFFEAVDWSKTRAYTLGFAGIYINRIGREYYGIIGDYDAGELKKEIAEKLKELKDPKTGEKVINNVYMSEDVFAGPCLQDAPDMSVGFNKGFRMSWQTVLGAVPPVLIDDNVKKWSGDHLVDPVLVPGVVFVNKKVALRSPSITDIAPSIQGLFNSGQEKGRQHTPLFKERVE